MRIITALPVTLAAARLLACLGIGLLVLLGGQRRPVEAAGSPTATAARVAGDESRTRFVADLTAPVGFTAYVLPDPYRVVIDLPAVAFELPPEAGRSTRGWSARSASGRWARAARASCWTPRGRC